MDILQLFTCIDDFCLFFEPLWKQKMIADKPTRRNRESVLCLSEVMTIMVLFHALGYRNFKQFYLEYVCRHLTSEFPQRPSYNRFVELQSQAMIPLWAYLKTCYGECSGVSIVDSTKIAVCHNRRITSHKVFAGAAERGKTSVDWFFGFKLHIIINDCGQLLRATLTKGNVDDRKPLLEMAHGLNGMLYGEKGYISQALSEQLLIEEGVELITRVRKNMKKRVMSEFDEVMLRKRSIVETVIDRLKNASQIEHTRHRSWKNFVGNLAAGLIAYTCQAKKPSLNLQVREIKSLEAIV